MFAADLDPEEFESDAKARLADAQRALDELLALPTNAPFARVIEAFDAIGRPLESVRGAASLASQVHPLQAVREAAQRVIQDIAAFATELSLNRAVFERLAALDPGQASGPLERRLLAHALRDYRRGGVDRDEPTRARIRELSDELVRVGQEFDLNIATDTRSIVVAEGRAGLVGLPADFIAAHAENERGEVVLTTDPTDHAPVMSYAVNGEVRRRLHFEYSNRAAPKNVELLRQLLAKRHEFATLLGYASWADYITEDKMVASAANARVFIERVAAAGRARMLAEYGELLAGKREDEPGADSVRDWERAYYAERVKSRKLGFDSQSVRPYFAYRNARDGVLATSAALYGIEFRRNTTQPVWHASVECFDIVDRDQTDAVVARVYLDMHPRPNKYKHGAMFDLRTGAGGEGVPEAALVCNVPEPTDSDPALLLHRDVTTFFHEFGHLLHHLFAGRQRFLAFAGIATEWDFVEVPSQLYEEWAWDAGVLARFARHFETGEPISRELVARMREADEYGKGLFVATQMYLAMLSLTYHDRDPSALDLDQHMRALRTSMLPFPHTPGTHFVASFGHLHGYSAIYYTYMWSLVIAKDLLSRFTGNLMNPSVAAAYRNAVLSPGGTRDATELVESFLGRAYDTRAWEAWLAR